VILNVGRHVVVRVGALVIVVAALATFARPAAAQETMVAAGDSLTLTGDIVLQGSQSFVAGAAGGARCAIDGATHNVHTMPGWTGRIVIASCDVTNLGSASLAAIDVPGAGAGATFDVTDTVFDVSGYFHVESFEDMTFVFRGNTIPATSVVPAELALDSSKPAFHFRGTGGATQKLFQGNRILRSWVRVEAGRNWLIGGSTPAEGNVIVGIRAGLDVGGNAIVVRGNYVHVTGTLAGWNQIAAFYGSSDDGSLLVEHNVIRGGNWLVRSFSGGELRYNLLGDPYAIAWVLTTPSSGALIHHNVMIRNNKLMETFYKVSGLSVVGSGASRTTEFYGNTLDGSGYCYDLVGRAVSINEESYLLSLYNNVFFNFPSNTGASNTALVGPGTGADFKDEMKGDPGPARIEYADYNLFFNPDAATKDNYGVSVAGLTERTSPGFAASDAPAGGAKDEQIDPRFTGPLPKVFPFADDDVVSGAVSVCQILAFYRGIYTPRSDSPAVDHGEGPGADIGAVGAGADDTNDKFGRLCADADNVLATPPTVDTNCPQAPGGGSGTAGAGGTPGHGFVCVCDTGGGEFATTSLAALAALALYARMFRPARRRPRK
jgi:hypothetical protein